MSPVIRPLEPADRAAWEPLWQGYCRFYRARLAAEVTDATWQRLVDPVRQPHGLAALVDGRLVGFLTYLFHPSTWALGDYCYLEDLYVAPEARGRGIARALFERAYAAADAAGAAKVYWQTQDFNAEARALYDTLGRRTSMIVYVRG
jgi:GNAT superfamily N-acetyltransferase